jgi:hypothetical protein
VSATSSRKGKKRKITKSAHSLLSVQSGVCSGDGILAAGREQVFNRVSVTRKAAAQAERERARRIGQLTRTDSASMTSIAESVMKRHRKEVSMFTCLGPTPLGFIIYGY